MDCMRSLLENVIIVFGGKNSELVKGKLEYV